VACGTGATVGRGKESLLCIVPDITLSTLLAVVVMVHACVSVHMSDGLNCRIMYRETSVYELLRLCL
jgi:hypothetical protein